MTNTGIWLDTRKAVVVSLTPEIDVKVVHSNIEEYHVKGGSKSKSAHGPVMTIKEKSYLERKKHQSIDYFEEIIGIIKGTDHIYIMGPAQTKNELNNFLKKQHAPSFNIVQIDSADSMTDNQIIAQVKQVFKNLN